MNANYASPNRHQQPLRILLVDDSPVFRLSASVFIRTLEDMVVMGTADNGFGALKLAAHYQPDLILLDLEMPGLDGMATTRRLREQGCTACIVMLTSHDEDYVRQACLLAGADGFVPKGIMHTELAPTLAKLFPPAPHRAASSRRRVLGRLTATEGISP